MTSLLSELMDLDQVRINPVCDFSCLQSFLSVHFDTLTVLVELQDGHLLSNMKGSQPVKKL